MTMMLFVSGCASLAGSETDDFCLIAQPIIGSASDTDRTLEQIEEHNTVWRELCE